MEGYDASGKPPPYVSLPPSLESDLAFPQRSVASLDRKPEYTTEQPSTTFINHKTAEW